MQTTTIQAPARAGQMALTFEQAATNTYSQLFNMVGEYVTHYRTDLTKHDRHELENYTGPFIYGYRPTGTTLLKLHASLEDYCKPGHTPTTKDEEEIKSLIVFISGPLSNKRFLHYNGQKFIKITEEKARAIYAAHIDNLISKARRQREHQQQTNF